MAAAAAIAGKLKDVRDLLPEMQAGCPCQQRPKGAVAVDHIRFLIYFFVRLTHQLAYSLQTSGLTMAVPFCSLPDEDERPQEMIRSETPSGYIFWSIYAAPRQGPPAPRSQAQATHRYICTSTVEKKTMVFNGIHNVFAASTTNLGQNTAIYLQKKCTPPSESWPVASASGKTRPLHLAVPVDFDDCWRVNWILSSFFQGIVGCTPTNVPLWEIPI